MRNTPDRRDVSRFDKLMTDEISRMQPLSFDEEAPPEHNDDPLTMREYYELLQNREVDISPTNEQIQRLIDRIMEDDKQVRKYAQSLTHDLGRHDLKGLVVLIPGEHGSPQREPENIRDVGYLEFYVLDGQNKTLLGHDRVYLDAILPREVIQIAVPLPEYPADDDKWEGFSEDVRNSIVSEGGLLDRLNQMRN